MYSCRKCHRAIARDRDFLGLCSWCERDAIMPKRAPGGGESLRHATLKKKAVKFLEGIGCSDVQKEARRGFRYDVLGKKGKQTYVVECGGIPQRRIAHALGNGFILYLWPYSSDYPIPCHHLVENCGVCGTIFSKM
jgi:hypothetical protein